MLSLLNLSASFQLFPRRCLTQWGGEGSCVRSQSLSLLRSQSLDIVGTQEAK